MPDLADYHMTHGALHVELRQIRLDLVHPHQAAHGATAAREVILVHLTDAAGRSGWGECSALSEPTYTSEYQDGCWLSLTTVLVPAIVAAPPDQVARALQRVAGQQMAKAALVSALLDLDLRARGVSLAIALGDGEPGRTTVSSTAVIGLQVDVDSVVARVDEAVADGFTSVKLKIEPGRDVVPVRTVRRLWPDLRLAVDANGSYSDTDTAADGLVGKLDTADIDLSYIEQPLPADDLVGSAVLARRLGVRIALDESIGSLGDACSALALGAMGVANVKPARVGGPIAAVAIARVLAEEGIDVFCGGMLESGIGRAASLAFAAQSCCSGPTDLGPTSRYFPHDITTPMVLVNGCLKVPDGPGIGVEARVDVVEATTRRVWQS